MIALLHTVCVCTLTNWSRSLPFHVSLYVPTNIWTLPLQQTVDQSRRSMASLQKLLWNLLSASFWCHNHRKPAWVIDRLPPVNTTYDLRNEQERVLIPPHLYCCLLILNLETNGSHISHLVFFFVCHILLRWNIKKYATRFQTTL